MGAARKITLRLLLAGHLPLALLFRLAVFGRQPETTKGRFLEAKPQKRHLGMRSLLGGFNLTLRENGANP